MATFSPQEFKQAMELYPKRLYTELRRRLPKAGRQFLHNIFVRQQLSGRPGLNTGTASLKQSFNLTIRGQDIKSLEMVEYTTSPYAPIHEYGGVITPKRSKYLAIPLPSARRGAKPRDYSNTFFQTSKAGNLILFQKRGNNQAPVPLFVMKSSVTIPPRLRFADSWKADQVRRQDVYAEAMAQAAKDMGRKGIV